MHFTAKTGRWEVVLQGHRQVRDARPRNGTFIKAPNLHLNGAAAAFVPGGAKMEAKPAEPELELRRSDEGLHRHR